MASGYYIAASTLPASYVENLKSYSAFQTYTVEDVEYIAVEDVLTSGTVKDEFLEVFPEDKNFFNGLFYKKLSVSHGHKSAVYLDQYKILYPTTLGDRFYEQSFALKGTVPSFKHCLATVTEPGTYTFGLYEGASGKKQLQLNKDGKKINLTAPTGFVYNTLIAQDFSENEKILPEKVLCIIQGAGGGGGGSVNKTPGCGGGSGALWCGIISTARPVTIELGAGGVGGVKGKGTDGGNSYIHPGTNDGSFIIGGGRGGGYNSTSGGVGGKVTDLIASRNYLKTLYTYDGCKGGGNEWLDGKQGSFPVGATWADYGLSVSLFISDVANSDTNEKNIFDGQSITFDTSTRSPNNNGQGGGGAGSFFGTGGKGGPIEVSTNNNGEDAWYGAGGGGGTYDLLGLVADGNGGKGGDAVMYLYY